ncbi:xaa-Pro aminopeptidase 2-like [Glandiceps talaboti]
MLSDMQVQQQRLNDRIVNLEEKSRALDEDFGNQTWTTFDEVAFVPFQYKLIKFEMMTPPQIDWMNRYNQEIRLHIGDRLYTKNRQAYDWMIENNKPVSGRGVYFANE